MVTTAPHIAVVGAGPVGLALALHAARLLPLARITVFDARDASRDIGTDPRTLALSLGSVQFLRRLVAWKPPQPILEVQVSQQPPSLGDAVVRIRADALAVPMLGAVASYGEVVAPLQRGWEAAVAAEPRRLALRLGTPVRAIQRIVGGVDLDADIVERFDLAVVAEGGVFAGQVRKAVAHDYRQTAWVGSVTLDGAPRGVAFERFTREGPVALLPRADGHASLVWCVPSDDDPVAPLNDAQRLAVLATRLPAAAGRLVDITPLKHFPLGLNAERTLVDGRSVRIGNAAQTLHPVAGQGLNLGLRDAHELVAALRHGGDIDAALARVEWARAPDRWTTIATTDFLARSFTWQLPGLALARGAGLAALQRVTPARDWLARRMMFGSR